MQFLAQALTFIFSFLFIFGWQNSFLANYTIQIFGFFIFLFLLVFSRKKEFNLADTVSKRNLLMVFTLNTVIFLLIFSTGGLSSSLFFLLYFLGFGIAFVFEPVTVFIFALGATLIFLAEALTGDVLANFLQLGSLFLISPLAFFFGREFRKEEKIERETQETADKITKDVGQVLESEKQTLKTEDVEKLNDILEETEKLRKE